MNIRRTRLVCNSYVLLLHRVSNQNKGNLTANENLKISQEYLEKFIKKRIKEGYTFIDLDELNLLVRKKKPIRKIMVFTADDGYKDLIFNGLPLLDTYNIPIGIFLVPNFLRMKSIAWWHFLEFALLQKNNYNLKELNTKFIKYRNLLLNNKTIIDVQTLQKEINFPFPDNMIKTIMNNFLDVSDIKKLKKNKNIIFGAHTLDHVNLKSMPDSLALSQILDSKKQLQEILQKEIRYFAYPFGSFNEIGKKNIHQVQQIGFELAFTNIFGSVNNLKPSDLYQIPRLDLTNNIANRFKISILQLIIRKKFLSLGNIQRFE